MFWFLFFFLLAVVAVIVNANVRSQVTNPQIWVLSTLNENIFQHLASPKIYLNPTYPPGEDKPIFYCCLGSKSNRLLSISYGLLKVITEKIKAIKFKRKRIFKTWKRLNGVVKTSMGSKGLSLNS